MKRYQIKQTFQNISQNVICNVVFINIVRTEGGFLTCIILRVYPLSVGLTEKTICVVLHKHYIMDDDSLCR